MPLQRRPRILLVSFSVDVFLRNFTCDVVYVKSYLFNIKKKAEVKQISRSCTACTENCQRLEEQLGQNKSRTDTNVFRLII